MGPQLAIVADDLTGAADTSACFADAGYATVIPLGGVALPAADVVALTTESRDLDATCAAVVVAEAVAGLEGDVGRSGPRWIYKKIDSALRGHPRDELFATMDALGVTRTIVAPALPSEGRTTVRGRQHVGGVPLERSSLGGPAATSDLARVFANDRGWPIRAVSLFTVQHEPKTIRGILEAEPDGIVIADAELDDDLAVLARAASESALRVFCGAAGFARQLAPVLPLVPSMARPAAPLGNGRPILVVAGSRHGATARQIAALERAGGAVVHLTQAHIDDPTTSIADGLRAVAGHLEAGRTTVVTTSGLMPSAAGERAVAARLAEIAAAPALRGACGGMVLTGGDVAAAVCAVLGATALWLGGEIYAGLPWGALAGGALPGLPVATKAGSFGDDGALLACVAHLQQLGRSAAPVMTHPRSSTRRRQTSR